MVKEASFMMVFCVLILLAFLLFKEFTRANKSQLLWRCIASVLGVASLFFLGFGLHYSTQISGKRNQIILLTEGTNFADLAQKNNVFYTNDENIIKEGKKLKIKLLPHLGYFLATHPAVTSIKIEGYGLPTANLEKLYNYSLTYKAVGLPNGVQNCHWSALINSGQELKITGLYQNKTSNTIKLVLKGVGIPLDSVQIVPQSTATFVLKTTPKQIGKSVYQLLVIDKLDTVTKEEIPFEVKEILPVSVLILASSPDFEYKFLKNWLLEQKFPVVYRTRISKDKFGLDFLNTPTISFKSLNAQNLHNFDVVIADDAELASLSNIEKSALNTEIANGLGLIIRSSEVKSLSVFSKDFGFLEAINNGQEKQLLSLQAFNSDDAFHPLEISKPYFLKEIAHHQPLILDKNKRILVDSKLNGAGKIVLNTVSTSFQWFLNGFRNDYQLFWSSLIQQSAKAKISPFHLTVSPAFPKLNQKVNLEMAMQENMVMPNVNVEGIHLNLMQNNRLSNAWQGTYWPQKLGWNSLNIQNQNPISMYVYPKESWQILSAVNKIKSTQAFVAQQKQNLKAGIESIEKQEKEVSKWWFFFLFLLCASYLWYEERRG